MPSTPISWYAYRNYRDLCEYLGEPVKTGQAKIDQLKHWGGHFTWENDGHKYIPTKILKPLSPRERLYHTNTKWYPNISKIILSMTKNALNGYGVNELSLKYRELIITSAQLYNLAGLCNPSFKNFKKGWEDGTDLSLIVKKNSIERSARSFIILSPTCLKA